MVHHGQIGHGPKRSAPVPVFPTRSSSAVFRRKNGRGSPCGPPMLPLHSKKESCLPHHSLPKLPMIEDASAHYSVREKKPSDVNYSDFHAANYETKKKISSSPPILYSPVEEKQNNFFPMFERSLTHRLK